MEKRKNYLKDLQLHKDKDGDYYLSAVYITEDKRGIYETTIPHICLPLTNHAVINIPCGDIYFKPTPTVDIGLGELFMDQDENGHYHVVRTIEEKVHNMTLSEIEKKLGYKVRVVSEKEE